MIGRTRSTARIDAGDMSLRGWPEPTPLFVHASGTRGDDVIEGTDGDDLLDGRSGDDTLYGYGGNDRLTGGTGNDRIVGGQGRDTVSFRSAPAGVTLDMTPGERATAYVGATERDAISGIENIIGTRFADRLTVETIASAARFGERIEGIVVDAGAGDDIVALRRDNQVYAIQKLVLRGGDGFDILDLTGVGSGNGLILNGIIISTGKDVSGFERIIGSPFDDLLFIGETSSVDSNDGNDQISYDTISDAIAVTLDGGNGDDQIIFRNNGASAPATLIGGAGNDNFSLYDWASDVSGGDGFDRVFLSVDASTGFSGPVTIDLGSGIDALYCNHGNAAITIDLAKGLFNADGATGAVRGVEHVYGTNGDDRITGDGQANTLVGYGGADVLLGGSSSDTLCETGNYDGPSDSASDVMTGGPGVDLFVFGNIPAAGANTAIDRITDFSAAERDRIDVRFVDFDATQSGRQIGRFIDTDAFDGRAGEYRYEVRDGNTFLMIDGNGDMAADMTIQLDGLVNLRLDDFLL